MKIDLLFSALAALIPLIIGFIWYNPKIFGTAWMNSAGLTNEKLKGVNMPLIFGLTFILSFFIAIALHFVVIHQWGAFSAMLTNPNIMESGSDLNTSFLDFMSKYGTNFRTFKHGALHGATNGLFFIMPILAINAMFERKGFKYIAINTGYWIVSLAIMGGIISQYANVNAF